MLSVASPSSGWSEGPRIAYRSPGRPCAALGAFPLRLVGCCRLLWLGAEPAPVAPTPQEFEEEAAKAALEPTEAQREAGYCRKDQINIGDLDVTIETVMGAEEKFPDLFFPTRGKMRLRGGGLSIIWDGQPLASDCRSIAGRSLLFRHNAVRVACLIPFQNKPAVAIHTCCHQHPVY